MKKQNIEEYYKELEKHNWYHLWSPDIKEIVDGSLHERELRKASEVSMVGMKMFIDFWNHAFFGKEKPELNRYMGECDGL